MKKRLCMLFLLVVVSQPLWAAESGSPLFQKAMKYYSAGQYDSTIIVIRDHLKKNGKDPEAITLVPLIIEAYMRKGEYVQVHRLIDMYRQKYEDAPYIPRLYYLEGVANAKEEKHSAALLSFSKALELGVSPELENLTITNVENICGRAMAVEELSAISVKATLHTTLLEIVRFYEVQKLFSAGQVVRARNSAEEFRKLYPSSKYDVQIKDVLGQSRERQKTTVQVGMLAPLSGDDAEVGKRVMQGAKLAIDDYNSRTPQAVKFIVYDTKGNMIETARKSKDLLYKDQVPVVIGPVLSYTATVSSAMFTGKDILMISPTASEEGIAELGDNIFQMNITIGSLGTKIARYAVENLNIKDFAVFAPNNSYGHAMAEVFTDELRKLNIEVVHTEFYEDGIHDFTPHFMKLRQSLLTRHLEKISADKGNLQKITQVSRKDSIRYVDSTFAVGGLFMPVEADDVLKLAPQAVFHRIRTQMLGSAGWYDPKIPAEGKRYVQNAIISTGFEPDQQSKPWLDFKAAYRARYNADPDKIAALGYDAAQLVIKAIEETGGLDVTKMKKALSSIRGYKGLSGQVSFNPLTGANTEAAIMKVTESGFVRVQ